MRASFGALGFVALASFGACSVVYSTDDLSRGGTGGSAGASSSSTGGGSSSASTTASSSSVASSSSGASSSSSSGMPKCAGDVQCDDGNPCTADTCDPMTGCSNVPMVGAACGTGTNCTPQGTCTAMGTCAPGQPDPSKCDDGNACTDDACGVSGCTHTPHPGASCFDGDSCHMEGTCDANAMCIAQPFPTQYGCLSKSGDHCPSGYYRSTFSCDKANCGDTCGYLINKFSCDFACGQSFTACCTDDCLTTACPPPYHAASGVLMGVAQCITGNAVTCSL